MTLAPGTTLGPYAVTAKIGERRHETGVSVGFDHVKGSRGPAGSIASSSPPPHTMSCRSNCDGLRSVKLQILQSHTSWLADS